MFLLNEKYFDSILSTRKTLPFNLFLKNTKVQYNILKLQYEKKYWNNNYQD